MRSTILIALLMGFFSSTMYSQSSTSNITIGEVFAIGSLHNNNYKHINFPKSNFIIKKGGIASYKHIKGQKVEVTSIKEKKDGNLYATIKLTSKRFFFNSHKYITVDIIKAIENKELLRI